MTTRNAGLAVLLLVAAGQAAMAEDAGPGESPSGPTHLPPVTVEAPAAHPAATKRDNSTRRADAAAANPARGIQRNSLTRVPVYTTTPLAGNGIDADKVPGTVTTVDASQIERTHSPNITDALQQYVPGVVVSSVSGNPFQPDVQFRGFTASPVSGTPQGLAVYQNGVRINEAFGDTVNWDLIPTAAIRSVTMVTNNPAYGLNALGGALNVQMKDGFSYHGAEIDTMGGSFGRIQSSLQWGKQVDNYAVYGALEGVHDDGFRLFSASNIRRFYGDVGYRNTDSEIHLNLGAADNNFGAAATVPIELLNANYGAVYTTPQTSTNKVGYANLTGKFDVTPTWTLDANAHIRVFSQQTVDGNPTSTQPCTADPTLLCFGNGATPANGLNGSQLANPFPSNAILGEIDRTSTATTTVGTTLQATNTDKLLGFDNRFTAGVSFDRSVTHFAASAELGTIGTDYVVSGSGIFLGASGNPVSDGPVGLRTVNQYTGLYALDALDLTKSLTLTAGGRFNVANIRLEDQLGTALNGDETYTRFNPLIGATYKLTSELTAYAGYSEANRAPTPLELGCADPAHPCILATFLVSDPALKQVVSRTVEAGLRGSREFGADIGKLTWKLGAFRTNNSDDIMAIPDPLLQGFGYFQNVGATRRQGVEAEARLTNKTVELYATYTFVDARFLDALQLGSNSPFADANGNIQVSPGNQIPAIPRHRVKLGVDYTMTDALKVGADMVYISSQYFVGDASNQASRLPGYAVVNLHGSYQIDRTWQVYGRIDNLLNNHYATYGTFFDTGQLPNYAAGGAAFTDARSVSPARPQAAYVGVKATF
jgi:outer membrane receptor protein involved in Fe transport